MNKKDKRILKIIIVVSNFNYNYHLNKGSNQEMNDLDGSSDNS
jgi:hypothetical protein